MQQWNHDTHKPKVSKFEDLFCWQLARELTQQVYYQSKYWKDYSLKDQIRRAAVSVLSNIAEGFERGTKEEFLHFLYIARGSAGEVRAQLYVAADQRYVTKSTFELLLDKADHTSRILTKFIDGYKKKGHHGPKYQKPVDKELVAFEAKLQKLVPKR